MSEAHLWGIGVEEQGCAVADYGLPDGPDGLGGCFPGPSTTGYQAAPDWPGSLTEGSAPIVSDTTYNFKSFAGVSVGTLSTPVSNVTFHGCRFKSVEVEDSLVALFGQTGAGGNGITFEYCSFEPGVAAPPTPFNQSYQYGIVADGSYGSFVEKLTVDHCDFWGFGNAIAIEGSTQTDPHVFTDNYIHDASDDGGAIYHIDGIGDLSGTGVGSYVVINHNTIVSEGNTNALAFQEGVYDHFTVTENLFSGFGYTIAIWEENGTTDITFTDNVFSTMLLPVFSPIYPQLFWTTTGSTWRRNKWAVPSGAAWGSPSHDGYFWMPVTDGIIGTDDTPYVSTTDYSG